jgi:hypothetical protein
VYDDVFSEAVKCGPLAGVAVPVPEESIPDEAECRVYVKYLSVDDAKKLKVCVCDKDSRLGFLAYITFLFIYSQASG